MKYRKERQEVIDCARSMEQYGLVKLSGGNVSRRLEDGNILVTPSAMEYGGLTPDDIVLTDCYGSALEGNRRPSSDLSAILYMFSHMPEIHVILHTHQPKAVAVSLLANRIPVISTTMADELLAEVAVAPFTISSDRGMGIEAVKYAGKSRAVILKQHGVVTFGDSFSQALSAAVYLEETCEVYLSVIQTGHDVTALTPEQIAAENAPRGFYGQP